MPFRVAEYCAWPFVTHPITFRRIILAVGLKAEGKDIWWKCGVGILGETEGWEARFGDSEAEWNGWKGRKRGVARLALTGDVTRMKTMIIGGAGALPYQLQ